MDVLTAINTRRSVRSYKEEVVPREVVEGLIATASQAPSSSNSQPWSFVVIQDREYLRDLSRRIKKFDLENIDRFTLFKSYLGWLNDEAYDVFYNTSTLIIICAKKDLGLSPTFPAEDCSLAAENLMLAAHAQGLGTCWIGFAREFFNLYPVKQELGITDNWLAVAPLIVGYPDQELKPLGKKPPEVKWISRGR